MLRSFRRSGSRTARKEGRFLKKRDTLDQRVSHFIAFLSHAQSWDGCCSRRPPSQFRGSIFLMGKFLDIPFDIFTEISDWAGAEGLFAIGQCNRKCREWAANELLWRQIIQRMQERGILLPPDGFTGLERMSFAQLRRCALRAERIRRNWSSAQACPTKSYLVDCNPTRHHPDTTQRLRWVIPITDDFFAVKVGYHSSSGFLQIWRRGTNAPLLVLKHQGDWIHLGHCTDLAARAWYYVFGEHNVHQNTHSLNVMRFRGFDSGPGGKIDMDMVARYPMYGSIINVFILDAPRHSLCTLYAGSLNNTVAIFLVPDWHQTASIHIDTGIDDDFATSAKHSFICWLDASKERLYMQFNPDIQRRGACQYVYCLRDLKRHKRALPAMPFHVSRPPLVKPACILHASFWDFLYHDGHFHERQVSVFQDHEYAPILPNTSHAPSTSCVMSLASPGHGHHPTYAFKHMYVGLAGARPFVRRIVSPAIRQMAFAQDYSDVNTTQRFPVGRAIDLLGHELMALGHGCAAWIEARNPLNSTGCPPYGGQEYDLKIILFPWKVEERTWTWMPQETSEMSVCTIMCPPQLDLARVTDLWLDAARGRIIIGLKWGKFVVLQFD